jgi:WD40 repeat protein
VGRRERELDPTAGPVQRFALELRELRESAGRPSYRELSKRAHYSVTTLSEAAGGVEMPSLAVTLAYVEACGGEPTAWETRWLAMTTELADEATAENETHISPYLGLAVFEPEHAEWFFGRQELVDELRARLTRDPLVAVFGASGSGKSSLLRAGLVPAVRTGSLTILFTPGQHPLDELAARMANHLGVTAGSVRADLLAAPENTGMLWRQLLAAAPDATRVLVVVDQFEEIFTLCGDAAERHAFVRCLAGSAGGQDQVRVVLGVRADFFARCARYPELVAALRDHQVLVGPMGAADLRSVVREPGLRAGMRVEAALVEAVVADAHSEPGALPLVSHALFETWKRRSGNTMTLAGYRLAGEVQGAIAQTAERVYAEFDEHEQALVQDVFLRLTALGQGTEDTRRRVRRAELGDDAAITTVLTRLAAARLVTLGDDTVEVAHEALIRSWPRLRAWLTEDRDQLNTHRRLTETAEDWENHDRDDGMLYRGLRLVEWDGRDTGRLNPLEREFLATSRARASAERAAGRRRVRFTVSGLAAAVVALTVLATVAFVQTGRAEDGRTLAFSRQLVAAARGQFQLDPELGLLLARQAYDVSATQETEAALRQATFESRVRAVVASHNGIMNGVGFSPDGKHVVTSGGDGTIRVWKYGRTLTDPIVAKPHTNYVWTPTFSPDGTRIVSASLDGTVSVWEWASDKAPVILKGHEGQVWAATFSPDGSHVASVGDDGTVRIWPADGRGQPVVLPPGHDGRTLGIAYNRDGTILASSGGDGTVRLWDLATLRTVAVLTGHENSVENISFDPVGGRKIATASTDGTVRLFDPETPTDPVVLGSHEGTAEGVTFSHDGTRVASTGNDGTVRIWNVDNSALPIILRGHRGTVIQAVFSPDDRRLISVSEDGTARIWDVARTGAGEVLAGHEKPVWAAAASADGKVVASASADGTVRVWHPGTNEKPLKLTGHDGEVLGVAVSRDGSLVAGTGDDKTVRIWSTSTGKQVSLLEGHTGQVWAAAFSPDGKRVVTGSSDSSVRVWPTNGRGKPMVIETDQERIRYIAFSADGKRIASAGLDGTIHVMDTDGQHKVPLTGHRGLVWSVAFSPDGRYVLSGGNDGTARLWDLRNPKREPRVLSGHQGVVWSVAYSPDGKFVATTGNDATTRIWRTTDTSPPVVLHGFGASVESAIFLTPTRLVSTHDDGTVRVWDCQPCAPMDQILRQAKEGSTRTLTEEERVLYLNEPSG